MIGGINPLVHYSLYGIKEGRRTIATSKDQKIKRMKINMEVRGKYLKYFKVDIVHLSYILPKS